MKIKILLLTFFFALPALADSTSVIGKWRTIDDVTGKPKSVVEISQNGGEFTGKIIELIDPSEPHPLCKECSGDKANKPIEGMEIIWGMHETKIGEEWSDGKIMDPKNGKTYKCRMKLQDKGDKLEVRGYIGFSLLGRSQNWIRVTEAAPVAAPAPAITK